MNWPLVHLVFLIALPLLTVLALVGRGVHRCVLRQRLVWASWVTAAWMLLQIFTFQRIGWYPWLTWFIPLLCITAFIALAKQERVARLGVLLCFVVGSALIFHATSRLPGHQRVSRGASKAVEAGLLWGGKLVIAARTHGQDAARVLPEGWIDAPGLLVPALDPDEQRVVCLPAPKMLWYSSLVSFAQHDPSKQLAVWCPGGRCDEVVDRLEVRVRERTP